MAAIYRTSKKVVDNGRDVEVAEWSEKKKKIFIVFVEKKKKKNGGYHEGSSSQRQTFSSLSYRCQF